jgi:hypothetical protein
VGDNAVGVLGPDEGPAAFVPAVDDRPFDGLDELAYGAEAAAADGLPGDDPEDQVSQDPRRRMKCKVIRGWRASHAVTAAINDDDA